MSRTTGFRGLSKFRVFLWTKHKWILHVTDHCVAVALCGCVLSLKKQQKYYSQLESYSGYLVSQPCYIPTMGKEIRAFCESHKINLVHGAPQTSQTQGLVERNNQTVQQNLSNIIKEKKKLIKQNGSIFWGEAAYKTIITVHGATLKSPYELLFGILPQHQTISHMQGNSYGNKC